MAAQAVNKDNTRARLSLSPWRLDIVEKNSLGHDGLCAVKECLESQWTGTRIHSATSVTGGFFVSKRVFEGFLKVTVEAVDSNLLLYYLSQEVRLVTSDEIPKNYDLHI